MNSYVALFCLIAVGLAHSSPVGISGYSWGSPWLPGHSIVTPILSPAAVSTASMYKGAPVPIIRTAYAPIVHAPILKTVPVVYGYHGVPYSVSHWPALG